MYLNISRNFVLYFGIAVLLFYYGLNKLNFILDSKITSGLVSYPALGVNSNEASIVFKEQGNSYTFYAPPNVNFKPNEEVKVIFNAANPKLAYVFSFLGFWYEGLLYCLIPLCFWCAFILGFFSHSDSFLLSLFGKQKLKTQKKDENSDLTKFKQSP
jgi:hypothetical protein